MLIANLPAHQRVSWRARSRVLANKAMYIVLSVTLVVGLAPSLALATESSASDDASASDAASAGDSISAGDAASAVDDASASDVSLAADAASAGDDASAVDAASAGDAALAVDESAEIEDAEATLNADSGTYGNFTWSVTGEGYNRTLTIEGYGAMNYAYSWAYPWQSSDNGNLCQYVTKIVLKDKDAEFTEISGEAFSNFDLLEHVEFPEHLKVIGDSAFSGCKKLGAITLPSSVTSIGSRAFCDCANMTLTTGLPEGLTSISTMCFMGCTNLQITLFSDNITSIGEKAFTDCKGVSASALPRYVTSIGHQAFMNCTALALSELPNTLTSIGEGAFCGCTGIRSLTVANVSAWWDSRAFADCTGLAGGTVKFLGPAPSEGANAFEGVGGVQVLYPSQYESTWTAEKRESMGSSVAWVLYACGTCGDTMRWEIPTGTDELVITGGGKMYDFSIGGAPWYSYRDSIQYVTFRNEEGTIVSIGVAAFKGCASLQEVNFATGITSIGASAFENCANLTKIQLPDTLISLGDYAFAGCTGLTLCKFDAALESIGMYAFQNCSLLERDNESEASITLYAAVKSIGQKAFSGCSALKRITFDSLPALLGDAIFEGVGPCTVRLGAACADQWTDDIKARCKGTDITWETAGTTKCGDSMTWSYINGTLTFTGSGEMYDYADISVPWRNSLHLSRRWSSLRKADTSRALARTRSVAPCIATSRQLPYPHT